MKNLLTIFLALSTALLIVGLSLSISKAQSTSPATARKPVVVELFTSEGCSSCPPADALLQKLQAQQPVAGAEIIAIEEHVDYWNHLGWVDPYSSADWTERQQVYVGLNRGDAYTPEMVVDGRSQFVGNNEREALREIEKAARAPKIDVSISKTAYTNGSQRFTVSVGKFDEEHASDIAEVWLAITEDGLDSSVSHGENSGRVLHHVATLRTLSNIGIADPRGAAVSFTGNPMVKIGPHWNMENLRATVFVQDKKSRKILGAATTKLRG